MLLGRLGLLVLCLLGQIPLRVTDDQIAQSVLEGVLPGLAKSSHPGLVLSVKRVSPVVKLE